MNGRIYVGSPVSTDNIPAAFYKWFEKVKGPEGFATMEVRGGEIQVVRVKMLAENVKAVEQLNYGKITADSSGVFLERTYIPRYSKDKDEIVLEQ